MTQEELELIEMIRAHKSPDLALITAIAVVKDYLKQLGSSALPSDGGPLGPA